MAGRNRPGVPDQEDWHAWYVERTGNQPNYSTLLEELATTQTERRAIIQGFLEPTEQKLEDGMKMPTPAHRAIAEMVKSGLIRVIITTNFDRLMENSLRDLGIEPTVVSSVDPLAGAEPITHTRLKKRCPMMSSGLLCLRPALHTAVKDF